MSLQSLVCGVFDIRTTDLCVGSSSSSLGAAPPTPSEAWLEDAGSVDEASWVTAGEGEPLVASGTGRESGEGSVSMSEESLSLTAMGSRTSWALPAPSGVSSSFEGAGSKAPRTPGDAASLESGGRFRWRVNNSESRGWVNSESRGWVCQGARYTGTNADEQVNLNGGAGMKGQGDSSLCGAQFGCVCARQRSEGEVPGEGFRGQSNMSEPQGGCFVQGARCARTHTEAQESVVGGQGMQERSRWFAKPGIWG